MSARDAGSGARLQPDKEEVADERRLLLREVSVHEPSDEGGGEHTMAGYVRDVTEPPDGDAAIAARDGPAGLNEQCNADQLSTGRDSPTTDGGATVQVQGKDAATGS